MLNTLTGRDTLWYAIQSNNRETSSLLQKTLQLRSHGETTVSFIISFRLASITLTSEALGQVSSHPQGAALAVDSAASEQLTTQNGRQ